MRILIVDPNEESRAILVSRVQESLRQIGLRRAELIEGGLDILDSADDNASAGAGFLGPGCFADAERSTKLFNATFPGVPCALVLENELYSTQAVELRRILSVRIMAIADIAQMAGFILDSDQQTNVQSGVKNRGIVSVTQLKGGVGSSTVAAGLAACWARNDLSVALLDFDDVNPQITDWARAGVSQRRTVSDLIRIGEVPSFRVNELLHPVEGYDGKLVVVPQPENYQESFHFKADVIEGAPSIAVFIESLLDVLRDEFDVIVADLGRSWGISSFAMLPHSQHVLLVTDDDGMSVRRTLDNLKRLARESDDDDEFDLSRWSFVLNSYTGRMLSPKELSDEIQELDLFPESAVLYTIPFSDRGRQWGAPGQSFYEMVEPVVKAGFDRVAFNLIPFRQQAEEPVYGKLRKRLQKMVRSSNK
jgi:cellulose biosynthesis protein BcsQ